MRPHHIDVPEGGPRGMEAGKEGVVREPGVHPVNGACDELPPAETTPASSISSTPTAAPVLPMIRAIWRWA